MADIPSELNFERHVQLRGRGRHPGYRRVLFGLVCLIPVAALLNAFGQHSTTSTTSASAATLHVQAPARLRGGLLYQVRIDVNAHRDLHEPQLVFGPGWWEQMTENSINPQPLDSSASNGRVTLSYQPLHPGQKLTVWLQFQVNPINLASRDANVLLTDGSTPVALVKHSLTVLP